MSEQNLVVYRAPGADPMGEMLNLILDLWDSGEPKRSIFFFFVVAELLKRESQAVNVNLKRFSSLKQAYVVVLQARGEASRKKNSLDMAIVITNEKFVFWLGNVWSLSLPK